MLRTVARFFAARPPVTVAVWVLVVGFGAFAYTNLLAREGFPSVESPRAVANGRYLIDDPVEVDSLLANQIGPGVIVFGDAISSRTIARPSSFSVFAEFRDGTSSEEAVEALQTAMFIAGYPEEAAVKFEAVNESKLLDQFDLLIAVTGEAGASAEDLDWAAQSLRPTIENDPAVDDSEVLTLLFEGTNPTTGQANTRETSFALFTTSTENGLEFRPAVPLGIRAADGVDSLELRAVIEDRLAELTAEGLVPDGFEANIALDFAPQIRQQIGSLESNALAGIIAVAVVALVLLSWRATIVTGLFLFSALATTFGVLYLFGLSLNTISLFGVILALGLLVDDAIVITEAIETGRDDDGDDDLAVVETAVGRVGPASVSGTLTTVLVFAPMLTITGVLGDFIRIIPISVIATLLVSLILSFVLIPTAGRLLILPSTGGNGRLARLVNRLADAVAALPGEPGRSHRGRAAAAIGFSLVMTGIGLFVFAPRVGFNIFPPQKDSTELAIEINYPSGTTFDDARAIAFDVNQQTAAALGGDLVSGFTFLGDERNAFTQLTLTGIGERATAPELVDDVLTPLAGRYDRARVTFSQISAGPPEPTFPFQAQIYYHNMDVLLPAAEAIRAELEGATLERSDGTTFTVIETEIAYTDVIARREGRRYVELRARFDADDVSTVTSVAQEYMEERFDGDRLVSLGLIRGSLEFDFGTESDNQESFASVPLAFGLALLLVLGLLIVQFRSISQWLLVFLAIPFSFFGVFGGLLLTGNVISFFVMVGLIGLIGIAVNNTILLTDYANQERRAGRDRHTAIRNAVRHRFRPLIATTATTIAGLLPLSLTDPFWEALGMTIIFGLLSSTLLVLVSFPFFYLVLESVRDRFPTPWRPGLAEVDAAGNPGVDIGEAHDINRPVRPGRTRSGAG